ncbi:MAG: ATP-dependent DNA helicase DinG [Alteromonadaceae bacterium]|nr:MAG: ATP-dependent DNA helicase DinG [Alteromonadaceae bacterium]
MLDSKIKSQIQTAYSQFLKSKSLKPRYGQKLMIAEVAKSLGGITLDGEGKRESGQHLCAVEAGTGTGKTVAYLLAVLPIAKALKKRVVISTATIALQEQVVMKDLPDIIRHSGLEFQFRLAKGRSRYLCMTKLDRILSDVEDLALFSLNEDFNGNITDGDDGIYQVMMDSLSSGDWDGDKDAWPEEIAPLTWQRVTTDHRQCTGRKCGFVNQCAFFKARDELDSADCVVANHDLVLADLALGGGAILPAPQNTLYIFDEGHHLPGKALNHFAQNTRYKGSIRWLGQSEGHCTEIAKSMADANYFLQLFKPLEAMLKKVRSRLEENLHVIEYLAAEVDRTQHTPRLRFEHGVVPESLSSLASMLYDGFFDLENILEKLNKELSILLDDDYPCVPKIDIEMTHGVIGSWLSRAQANASLWRSYSDAPKERQSSKLPPIARWVTLHEFNEAYDFELVSSPILAAATLRDSLWDQCCGALVTSATLTALGTFERFDYRAGTGKDCVYLQVPSPFDYANNAVLSVPSFAVEANNVVAHTESVVEAVQKIIDVDAGSLVLFSSRKQMFEVHESLPREFADLISMQGVESKQALLKKHRERIDQNLGSIIFGLASFSEGVDLPGAYCTHVIIAKLPFSVPDDPQEAALAEWIESQGGNSFMQISVPDASMRLIQAAGRLLRSESDTGKVTILDKRILTKRYGRALIDALPPFKRDLS